MKTTRLIALTTLGIAAACSGGTSSSGAAGAPAPAAASAAPSGPINAEVITQGELAQSSVADLDALDAIQRLRPRFFQRSSGGSSRGGGGRGGGGGSGSMGGSVTPGKASVNGGPLVGTDELKKMRANSISEVRYLNPDDASQRFGSSAGNTFVLVVTLKS